MGRKRVELAAAHYDNLKEQYRNDKQRILAQTAARQHEASPGVAHRHQRGLPIATQIVRYMRKATPTCERLQRQTELADVLVTLRRRRAHAIADDLFELD